MNPSTPADTRLLDDLQLLTPYASQEILKRASSLECQCPKHLAEILGRVREFQAYELRCINLSEKDRATHEWLYQAGINIDQLLSATIIQLARLEGMVDADNRIIAHPSASGPG